MLNLTIALERVLERLYWYQDAEESSHQKCEFTYIDYTQESNLEIKYPRLK